MYSYGSPHTAAQKQDDQHERTFSSYVRIQVVVLKTYLGRWTIGRSGERGSGISVLPARYDDDDDDISSSSSSTTTSCRAISTDILDPLSPQLPIVHCCRQILKATSRIGIELLYVGSSWTSCLCSSIGRGPQEYITYKLVPTSSAVSCVSGSSNFDSFRYGWYVVI